MECYSDEFIMIDNKNRMDKDGMMMYMIGIDVVRFILKGSN